MHGVFNQCNTPFRLLHLLYDTEVMWRKTIKHASSMFYTNKIWVFHQSESALGPIYIIHPNKTSINFVLLSFVRNLKAFDRSKVINAIFFEGCKTTGASTRPNILCTLKVS